MIPSPKTYQMSVAQKSSLLLTPLTCSVLRFLRSHIVFLIICTIVIRCEANVSKATSATASTSMSSILNSVTKSNKSNISDDINNNYEKNENNNNTDGSIHVQSNSNDNEMNQNTTYSKNSKKSKNSKTTVAYQHVRTSGSHISESTDLSGTTGYSFEIETRMGTENNLGLPSEEKLRERQWRRRMKEDPYELIAFVLWYLVLVLCCVIPTCCAYRRRRQMEVRANNLYENQPTTADMAAFALARSFAAQQQQQQLQILQQRQEQGRHSTINFYGNGMLNNENMLMLSGPQSDILGSSPLSVRRNPTSSLIDSEQIRLERCRIFAQELKLTTMLMNEDSIEECQLEEIAIHKQNYMSLNSSKPALVSSNSIRSIVSTKDEANHGNKAPITASDNGDNNIQGPIPEGNETNTSSQNSKEIQESSLDEAELTNGPEMSTGRIGTGALEHHTTLDEFLFVDSPTGNDDDVNSTAIIRLPGHCPNGDRSVPALCAICLCQYEVGDSVSWSPVLSCQHAFHTDCIVEWLVKKQEQGEAKCPLCRHEFCPSATASLGESQLLRTAAFQQHQQRQDAAAMSLMEHRILLQRDLQLLSTSTFLEQFSQALALSQFYRPETSASNTSQSNTRSSDTNQLLSSVNTTTPAPSQATSSPSTLTTRRLPIVTLLRADQQSQQNRHFPYPLFFPYPNDGNTETAVTAQSSPEVPSQDRAVLESSTNVNNPPFSLALDNLTNYEENANANPDTNTHN